MAIAKRTRKQIESHITKCAESIQRNGLEIGQDLIEIRDEELWCKEEPKYPSWNQYLKETAAELVGKSFVQSIKFVRAAEVANRIPSGKIIDDLTPSHLVQIGRLAPNVGKENGGKEKDYSKLRKQDVARVIKAAGPTPSVRDIEKAVDEELGIDQKKEAKRRKAKLEADRKAIQEEADKANELSRVIARLIGTLREHQSMFEEVPDEGWEWLAKNEPSLCQTLADACKELADFMRG